MQSNEIPNGHTDRKVQRLTDNIADVLTKRQKDGWTEKEADRY